MKSRSQGRWIVVVAGVLTLAITASALLSRAQPGLRISIPALPRVPDFLKVPHPACLDCFTYICPTCYVVFEEVPGTRTIIAREMPNPAPLEPGEKRLDFDLETDLPIWYIGHQPYIGPTDEQPFSSEFPRPKIELKRIQVRHQGEIFSIPGVHAFGIGARGFLVFLDPEHLASETLVPTTIEGVPVEVQLRGPFVSLSHQASFYRPVPTSANVGAFRPEGTIDGTSGPHIVLNSPTRI